MSATRVPWFEKSFPTGEDAGAWGELLERLRAAPVRVRAVVAGLPRQVLTRRDGEQWSLQEHAGHLWDLEDLHRRRLRDYRARARELRPAELANRRTWQAGHNDDDIEAILEDFRWERELFVSELEGLSAEERGRAPNHPRLGQPMSPVGLMRFVAEHDDHHLELMRDLVSRFAP
ncbi:MAG TPA: DinB family protein [bacterium]|nr:DinB family protein [bacterium]